MKLVCKVLEGEYKINFPYLLLIYLKKDSEKDWVVIVITGGFALVNNNKVTILVNEAELGSLNI